MTIYEIRILEIHNSTHERQAKSVTVYDDFHFYMDYQDGKRKHDYECGPSFVSIAKYLLQD